ncbi:F-box/TPR repeat protein pof3 [Apiospora rasikravindrae]|uniref:F-box/TPR repeat protein pof3 n=1 Tax=Apiospora rasikravindrae TaxID=990691 RepID=A0ABR1TG53_9PEZI
MRRTTSTAASQETALERGKLAYNAGNLTGAVALLKEAVRGCCPNSTVTDGPCTCRDLLRALQENDLRAQLVARCKCKAKLDKRCRNQGHMDALNLLTLIAMKKSKGKSVTATSLASEMIWRNPRDPSGYLRLGQILRRDQKPAIAFDAYSQGAMLVAEKYPDHPRLEVLRLQADAVEKAMRKVDPIQALPLELINMIFTMLDTTEICRCLQVSKTWRAKLESADARDVWLHQSYTLKRTKHGLASKVFHRYIQSYTCGRLRSFSIKDESGFLAKNFGLFSRSCGELQHLTLKGSINLSDSLATTSVPYRLETLHIGNRVQYSTKSLDKFLTYCSKTLRELSLLSLPDYPTANGGFWTPSWPDLPLLETLKLSGMGSTINLPSIADCTPNVRELWLERINTRVQASDVPETGFWPKAERLYCRAIRRWPVDLSSSNTPLFGISERIAELFLDGCELDCFFEDSGLYEGGYDGALANLKSLSLANCAGAGPEKLKRIIVPALESRSLEVLQLNPYPLPSQQQQQRRDDSDNSYAWLRNKCVKHLTVGGLNLRHGLIDLDAALTAIVAQCGALGSLDIGQEAVQASTLVAFIKKDRGVRALYHNNPELPTYDLQTWVREKDLGEVHRRAYPGSSDELWTRLYDW